MGAKPVTVSEPEPGVTALLSDTVTAGAKPVATSWPVCGEALFGVTIVGANPLNVKAPAATLMPLLRTGTNPVNERTPTPGLAVLLSDTLAVGAKPVNDRIPDPGEADILFDTCG